MSFCPKPTAKVLSVKSTQPPKRFVTPPAVRTESCNAATSTTTTVGGQETATNTTTYVPVPQPVPGKDGWGYKWESTWAEGKEYVKQKDATPNASAVYWQGNTYICVQDHTSTLALQPVDTETATMDFKGAWAAGEVYTAYGDGTHKSSTVTYGGKTYYCIQSHISEEINAPQDPDQVGVGTGAAYWSVIDTENGSAGEGKNYWELQAHKGDGVNSLPINDKTILEELEDFKNNVFDWIENADLYDWLKAGAIAAGVIWAGSKVMDMLDPEDPETSADARYNGSPGYSGAYTAPSLPDVVASLCDYAGITYDVSALPDEPVSLTIGNATSVRTILEQLSVAFQFDCVNSGGVLKFVPRNTLAVKSITLADMGFTSSTQLPAPYSVKRMQGVDLPRFVSLTYKSEDVDYNNYTQSAELYTYEDGQIVNLEVPVTLSHEKAKAICEISLTNAHLERTNFKFTTSYKFLDVEPGDILNAEALGLIRVLRVSEKEEGILEFECCDAGVEAANMVSNTSPQLPAPSINVPVEIGYSQAFWIDTTNLNDQDKGVRIYAAVHGYGKTGWPGAAIYMSEDNGASYEQIGTSYKEATLGLVAIATPAADYHVWDNTTEITVQLKTGTLLSKSELAVLNGANWCQVGQEMIGFKNATLIGEKTYKLSGLLRGLQGTEQFISTHQANELFCLLDDALVKLDFPDSDRGKTKKFKIVTIGSSLDLVEAEDVQIISNNTRMWTVYGASITKTGDDFVITWNERVRFDNQLKDYATTNHDYDWGGFGIAILNGDNNDAVKRTLVQTGNTFTYTAAMQIQDFGAKQAAIKVSILQMSQKWGGGFPVVINS